MLDNNDTEIKMIADTDADILFGYAAPFNEPFVAYGPFVMNTRSQIEEAYADYHGCAFGSADALP